MAVYTEVPDGELDAFAAQYDIGRVLSCKGIAEGVENSNYLLHTDRATYILTLYEKRVAPADLPFFLGLMDHLAGSDFALRRPNDLSVAGWRRLLSACMGPAAEVRPGPSEGLACVLAL